MKSLLLFLFIIFISTPICAQSIEWSKALGGGGDDGVYSVRQTKDGGYIMAGFTTSIDGDLSGRTSDGDNDAWIVKLSSKGAIEWKKFLGGAGDDIAYWVDETSDGYIVAANSSSSDGDVTDFIGAYDYWIIKLTTQGQVQWKKSFGGAEEDDPQMIRQASDGGYIVAGSSFSTDGDVSGNHGSASSDCWIVKLTSAGTIDWAKCYGGSLDEEAVGIRETPDKGFIVAGFSYSLDGNVTGHHLAPTSASDGWAFKIDKNGALEWQRSIGGNLDDQFDDVELAADGGYIFVGYTHSNDGDLADIGHHGGVNLSDALVVKLSATGATDWIKTFGGRDDDEMYTISKCSDGSFVIAAYTGSDDIDGITQHGIADYWLVRIDKDGNGIQQMTYGGSDFDQLYSISQTSDKGFILGGYSISSDQQVVGNHADTTTDAWIVKTLAGNSAVHISSELQEGASLYPNPMTDHSMIILPPTFASGHSVLFSLVSITGSEVRSEALTHGDNYLMFERGGLSAGLYHYRFIREDGVSMGGNLIVQ
jgi:hypothetical protein